MKCSVFVFFFAFLWLPGFLSAQQRISTDLIQPVVGGLDDEFGVLLAYERKLGERSSYELGLTGGKILDNDYYRYQGDNRVPEAAYRERTFAAGLQFGYRLYLKPASVTTALPRGLFLSPYGKVYLTQTRRDPSLTEEIDKTTGYLAGLGIGAGAVLPMGNWSLTPFIGVGRGVTSDNTIYQPGTDIKGLDHHLFLSRIELSVGYSW